MKFGRNLQRNQVPEWSSEYIDYKGLKKLIKSAANELKNGRWEADLAEFFFSLDRNVEIVDAFYNRKEAEFARRLRLLNDRYGHDALIRHGASREEIEDIRAALLELRSQLRKLQWYGEVNRRGFVKITKKLDKKVPTACAQQRYLQTCVDPHAFATNTKLAEDKDAVNTWLSKLGDMKPLDDVSDTASSSSLAANPQTSIDISRERLNDIEQAIKKDDLDNLVGNLKDTEDPNTDKSETSQKLLLFLLQRAISCYSKRCAAVLLERLDSLEDPDDINGRNCLHRLVIMIGRAKSNQITQEKGEDLAQDEANNSITPAEAPSMQGPLQGMNEMDASRLLGPTDAFLRFIRFFLDNLSPIQRKALQVRDNFGCIPLHYAAQYGFAVICNEIINRMRSWNQFNVDEGFDSKAWQDEDFHSPLHLSVMGGHPKTTQVLIDACRPDTGLRVSSESTCKLSTSSDLLIIATRSNSIDIVKMLVEAEANINYQDKGGETALHAAARFGHADCAKVLLDGRNVNQADIEVPEYAYGWTPIFVACVDGQFDMVKLLVNAGANVERKDVSGWTAIEHAALRGHIGITIFLEKHTFVSSSFDPRMMKLRDSELGAKASSLEERTSANGKEASSVRAPATVKSFGHRYLTDESMIFLSLGSMDHRKMVPAVRLDHIPVTEAHATQLDTALSVVVSAIGASGEPTIIDLPVQENISTDPVVFYTKDVSKVKIHFDLVPTYAGSKDQVLGRAVAPLSSLKANIGSNRMNLQGDLSIPIIAARNLDSIGFVNFNFLAITPFSHPNMSINETSTYWKSLASPMVIGHRGLGKNMASRKSLQLGENTIQSFVAAANLGASYVEFDVQLTKDHVPVIYHDFLVSETGIDAPVHTLTLEQFLHVNQTNSNAPSPRTGRSPSRGRSDGDDDRNGIHPRYAQRARSFSNSTSSRATTDMMSDRMRHTRDFKTKGYKANSRGNFIQAPFTTLEEMLKKLPSNIGFNIEIKYPMLFESEEQGMDTYAVECNSFVDTILSKVYDLGKGRDILFSSFNPDICLLLSFKQPSIPVLFLTDAGTSEVGDIRASSLQEAVRFASRWNLLGVVSASEPLIACPRLVKVVKESGLVCVSYGTQNNEPANVKKQMGEGIDAVIVDSVLAIRKGLTHEDPKVTTPPSDKVGLSDGQSSENKMEEGISLEGSTVGETSPSANGVAGMKLNGEKGEDYFGSGDGSGMGDKSVVNGVPLTPYTYGAVV